MQGKSMPTATMEISGSRVQNALAACKTLELEQSITLCCGSKLEHSCSATRNLIYFNPAGCSK